ncbi:MAG: hydrogenase maturation protease [Pyrinomonadaceae bacterium]
MTEPRILIACIGNIFQGDDAFGVEVAKHLQMRKLPENVRVIDFGIRGYDLTFALVDGYDVTILVDAAPRGEAPGTLYIIEPDIQEFENESAAMIDAHTMNPMNVLRVAHSMGAEFKRLLLVGCEPETLGGEEGLMGLSEPVEAAIPEAVNMIESLLSDILAETGGIRPLSSEYAEENLPQKANFENV